jgi:hypothetical protein
MDMQHLRPVAMGRGRDFGHTVAIYGFGAALLWRYRGGQIKKKHLVPGGLLDPAQAANIGSDAAVFPESGCVVSDNH